MNNFSLKQVTLGIKTFNRPNKIAACLIRSAEMGFRKIIVCDDGFYDGSVFRLYERISHDMCFELLRPPKNIGLSAGRNWIVQKTETPYLMMIDDDMLLPSNLVMLVQILESNEKLGGVAGYLREHGRTFSNGFDIEISDGVVLKRHPKAKLMRLDSFEYRKCEFIPNATMFRTCCLLDLAWDPRYKIGREHEDFYLEHKLKGVWDFAVSSNVLIDHVPEGAEWYDKNFRTNPELLGESIEYFNSKWHVGMILHGLPVKGWSAPGALVELLLLLRLNLKTITKLTQLLKALAPTSLYSILNRKPRR